MASTPVSYGLLSIVWKVDTSVSVLLFREFSALRAARFVTPVVLGRAHLRPKSYERIRVIRRAFDGAKRIRVRASVQLLKQCREFGLLR
jgi:hypothetical protein